MPAYAVADPTIRIPRQHFGPTRALPQRFAKDMRREHWPHILIAVLAVVALATPIKLPQHPPRSAQAQEVLRLLGR